MTRTPEEIAACPFCGKPPTSFPSGDGSGLMIECITPGCVNPHCSYIPPEAAVATWNTRPDSPSGRDIRQSVQAAREGGDARELLAAACDEPKGCFAGYIRGGGGGYIDVAHALRAIEAALSRPPAGEVERALLAVVDAVRDYLRPDGIENGVFIGRVIGAVDNPLINPIIREIENGRS